MKVTIDITDKSEWTLDDWDELHKLDQICFNDPKEGYERAWPIETLVSECEKGLVILIRENSQLIGACIAYNESGRLYVSSICVHPNWQRQGLAGRMLGLCERFARIAGIKTMWLEYRVDFLHLKRFYHKYGFVDMPGPNGKRKPRDPQPSVKELWRKRKWQKNLRI